MINNFGESPAEQVGHYLKRALKSRGISQEAYAEKIHVDPRTVRRWISNGVNSVDVLFDIMEFFNTTQIGDIVALADDVPNFFILGENIHFNFLNY